MRLDINEGFSRFESFEKEKKKYRTSTNNHNEEN